jgi:hypothetical protein
VVFETLTVREEGAVLFAEIAAPPMNLLGPELVRDLVSLIQRAEADDAFQVLVFKSADPDYFISHVDVTRIKEYREEAAKLTGEASIALLFRHLSCATPRRKAGSEPRLISASRPERRKWPWPGCWATWLSVDPSTQRGVGRNLEALVPDENAASLAQINMMRAIGARVVAALRQEDIARSRGTGNWAQ